METDFFFLAVYSQQIMTPIGSLITNRCLRFVYQMAVLRILKQFQPLLLFKESSHWKEQVQRNNVMIFGFHNN